MKYSIKRRCKFKKILRTKKKGQKVLVFRIFYRKFMYIETLKKVII